MIRAEPKMHAAKGRLGMEELTGLGFNATGAGPSILSPRKPQGAQIPKQVGIWNIQEPQGTTPSSSSPHIMSICSSCYYLKMEWSSVMAHFTLDPFASRRKASENRRRRSRPSPLSCGQDAPPSLSIRIDQDKTLHRLNKAKESGEQSGVSQNRRKPPTWRGPEF